MVQAPRSRGGRQAAPESDAAPETRHQTDRILPKGIRMTSSAPPSALAFRAALDFDGLHDRLNEVGPWQWRGTDSDTYGNYLTSRPEDGVTLRIFGERPDWVLQISRLDDAPMSRDEIDAVLNGQIFPA